MSQDFEFDDVAQLEATGTGVTMQISNNNDQNKISMLWNGHDEEVNTTALASMLSSLRGIHHDGIFYLILLCGHLSDDEDHAQASAILQRASLFF